MVYEGYICLPVALAFTHRVYNTLGYTISSLDGWYGGWAGLGAGMIGRAEE
jgi:hypothetical protein